MIDQEYKKLEYCILKEDPLKHYPKCIQCNYFEKSNKAKYGYALCKRRELYVMPGHLCCYV